MSGERVKRTMLPAVESRAYCACGCGRRESHATMSNCPHPGFGGVCLTRDGEAIYPWGNESHSEEMNRTWQDYEDVAASDPDCDWRLRIDGPLSDYTYQRQGDSLWVLVEQGTGFA